MTRELWVDLDPRDVLEEAKAFFAGPESGFSGTPDGEGPSFVRFRTFRGTLTVTAVRESADGRERTRVRVSTLRAHPAVAQFLTLLRTEDEARASAA